LERLLWIATDRLKTALFFMSAPFVVRGSLGWRRNGKFLVDLFVGDRVLMDNPDLFLTLYRKMELILLFKLTIAALWLTVESLTPSRSTT
jgi:hypothetical protein